MASKPGVATGPISVRRYSELHGEHKSGTEGFTVDGLGPRDQAKAPLEFATAAQIARLGRAIQQYDLALADDREKKVDGSERKGYGLNLRKRMRSALWKGLKHGPFAPVGHLLNVTTAMKRLRTKRATVQVEHNPALLASKLVYEKPGAGRDKIPGYVYKAPQSNDEVGVWMPKDGGKPVIAFRGTTNLDDAKTDAALAVGELKRTKRWQRNRNHYDQVVRTLKLHDTEHWVTGHSLGGTLAHEAAAHNKSATPIMLNPGVPITGLSRNAKKGHLYTTLGDAVSALSTFGTHNGGHNVRVLPDTSGSDPLSSHSVDTIRTAPVGS